MNMKKSTVKIVTSFSITVIVALSVLLIAEPAWAWGFFGHQRINRMAVFTLPPEMIVFYKEHLEYITSHAVDPDKRRYAIEGEDKNHYIDIDIYGKDPFDAMPRNWDEAVEKFTEDTIRTYGILPWNLEKNYFRLKRAFEDKNQKLILKYSADIGHYIGDAHVPLHTTVNYNGQLSGQKGIHGFWESRIPESFASDYDFFVGKAEHIKNIKSYIWDFIAESHVCVDSVLTFEKILSLKFPADQKYAFESRGVNTMRVYSKEYTEAYNAKLDNMVERRMRATILSIGSIWYTAWVNAGQPDLSNLGDLEFSEEELKEEEELNKQYNSGKIKGRDHGN